MLIFGIMLEFYIFRYKLRSRRDDSSGRERMENLRSSWSPHRLWDPSVLFSRFLFCLAIFSLGVDLVRQVISSSMRQPPQDFDFRSEWEERSGGSWNKRSLPTLVSVTHPRCPSGINILHQLSISTFSMFSFDHDRRNLQAKTVGLLELGELLKYLEVAAHKMSKMTRPVVLKPRIKQVRFTLGV